jgi:hypothetical protein
MQTNSINRTTGKRMNWPGSGFHPRSGSKPPPRGLGCKDGNREPLILMPSKPDAWHRFPKTGSLKTGSQTRHFMSELKRKQTLLV